jgi:hypothetical protein
MRRRAALGLAVYAIEFASLFTPLYEPLTQGRDESWAILVLLAGAHLALGLAVARVWVVLVPVVPITAAFVGQGAEGLAWVVLFLGLPAAVAATAVGWAVGRALSERALAGALVAVLVATAWPVAWAGVEQLDRASASHVPESVQARLPTEESLGNLCPGAGTPQRIVRRLERGADLLVRELKRRPDALVSYTYYWEEQPAERRDITVEELAQEQLGDLDSGGPGCRRDLQRRIRAAMD